LANTKSSNNPMTMEELLASQSSKPKTFEVGQEVEGKILFKSDNELIVDFGSKSEGVISLREFPEDQQASLKVGDTIKGFIVDLENSEGQSILSLNKTVSKQRGGSDQKAFWQKFASAKQQGTTFSGKSLEVNKGGLILEVEGVRGFLPSSQIGGNGLTALLSGNAIGVDFSVKVSEVDQNNNRLIFTQKGITSQSEKDKSSKFSTKQKVTMQIKTVLPFGLVVVLENEAAFVSPQDLAWERIDNLESKFKVGDEISGQIVGIDPDLNRINVSLKNIDEDPLAKFIEKSKDQEVVKGTITEISEGGVAIKLDENVFGFIPSSKVDSAAGYEVGQSLTVVIDNIDTKRRKISLTPFITTTKGLIYK
jgi:small subunit ribosomal protein S1